VLRGETDSIYPAVFGHFSDAQRMIRTDRWKLIHYPKVERYQLFDLENDPYELRNVAVGPCRATVFAELRTKLEAWQKEVGDPLVADRTSTVVPPRASAAPAPQRPDGDVPPEPVWANVPDVEALPNDVYKIDAKSGEKYNASRNRRRWAAAKRVLADFEKQLVDKSPGELIELIHWGHVGVGEGVKYGVAIHGNELIEAELARRGEAARQVLEAHREDHTAIFTGANGRYDRIATMCRRLLAKLPTE
jgi:hypothetical protein